MVSERKLIIGSVNGNFDDHEGTDLRTLAHLADEVVETYKETHYLQALDLLNYAKKAELFEDDICALFAASREGRIRELVVEENYYVPGYIFRDGTFSPENIGEGSFTADIINHIVHNVQQYGGDVTFVPPFYLSDTKANALLRWKEPVSN